MAASKSKTIWAFGDFQTPDDLARQVITTLQRMGINPAAIVEPTCGLGNLLLNALKGFPQVEEAIGAEINAAHVERLRERLMAENVGRSVQLLHANFFELDWAALSAQLPQPILVLGNPPWVTSADLGLLQSGNLPKKSNFHGRNGLDALTGKSNFDISEWMLLQNFQWLRAKTGTVAMLCKTSVARKVLRYAWTNKVALSAAQLFKIDAKHYFNAAVDACLLVVQFGKLPTNHLYSLGQGSECAIFETLSSSSPSTMLGYQDGYLLADVAAYQRLRQLRGVDLHYTWRSGIKHDCAQVMEIDQAYQEADNAPTITTVIDGSGYPLCLEQPYLYPMLKSSDISNRSINNISKSSVQIATHRKYMIVTQKSVGEETNSIQQKAPQLWDYLQRHKAKFQGRGSSIYKNRPEFSIFGVGGYTFTPWKVAISGFYKKLHFVPVGPIAGKPVVFDDTVYFLACSSEAEANFLAGLLNSELANQFLRSMIFWEEKRPITIELLKRLDIYVLACALGKADIYLSFVHTPALPKANEQAAQLRLLEEKPSYG